MVCSMSSLLSNLLDGAVDELASVVGVKTQDAKGELQHHRLEHGLQIQLTDTRCRRGDLPLRDLIDGIDVIDPFALGAVALMHRIQAQIAGPSARRGLAPLADGHGGGPRFGVVQAPLAVALALAQVVKMGHGDGGQPRVLRLVE